MSLAAALVAGGLIGIRHAFEPDHLAAIATLVDADDETGHPGRVGASWGVGHSLPILLIGLLFVLVGIRLPAGITTLFEVAVGIVLVYLGVRMLYEAAEPAVVRHVHGGKAPAGSDGHHHHDLGLGHDHAHAHGPTESHNRRGEDSARADHDHDRVHRHFQIGGLSLGRTHGHVDDASFLVGILHGLAGSGALVIALVSTAPSIHSAVAFLAAFSVLSILTMGGVSYLWGRSLERGFADALEALAGVMGIGVGLLLIADHLLGIAVL